MVVRKKDSKKEEWQKLEVREKKRKENKQLQKD